MEYYPFQGRSQPHRAGWARFPLSSFFPQISISFSYFSSNFTYFLPHFCPPDGRVAHPGRPWLRHWPFQHHPILSFCIPKNALIKLYSFTSILKKKRKEKKKKKDWPVCFFFLYRYPLCQVEKREKKKSWYWWRQSSVYQSNVLDIMEISLRQSSKRTDMPYYKNNDIFCALHLKFKIWASEKKNDTLHCFVFKLGCTLKCRNHHTIHLHGVHANPLKNLFTSLCLARWNPSQLGLLRSTGLSVSHAGVITMYKVI